MSERPQVNEKWRKRAKEIQESLRGQTAEPPQPSKHKINRARALLSQASISSNLRAVLELLIEIVAEPPQRTPRPAEPAPPAAPLARDVSDTLVRRMQKDAAYCREILAELARLEAENAALRTAQRDYGQHKPAGREA